MQDNAQAFFVRHPYVRLGQVRRDLGIPGRPGRAAQMVALQRGRPQLMHLGPHGLAIHLRRDEQGVPTAALAGRLMGHELVLGHQIGALRRDRAGNEQTARDLPARQQRSHQAPVCGQPHDRLSGALEGWTAARRHMVNRPKVRVRVEDAVGHKAGQFSAEDGQIGLGGRCDARHRLLPQGRIAFIRTAFYWPKPLPCLLRHALRSNRRSRRLHFAVN